MSTKPETTPVRMCERTYVVDDLTVRSDGSGRVVEAYAAIFGVRSEINDQDGHYFEENAPTSFTKTIKDKGPKGFGVLFNHGRTVDGTPNPMGTMPIGVPEEVSIDERGVFTATRYLDNPLADHVLDAIKQGALTAQSYSGRFIKSTRTRSSQSLPVIIRQEIDMREYGPAVFAAYTGATILGTRAENLLLALRAMTPEERLLWAQQYEGLPTLGEPDETTLSTPHGAAGQTEESLAHSDRSQTTTLAAYVRLQRIRRNM
jgi:HK97 family phage prohead protease